MQTLSFFSNAGLLLLWAPTFILVGYATIFVSRLREGETDPQATLKLVLYFLLVIGLGFALDGAIKLLHFMFSLSKAGSGTIKQAIAGGVSGGVIIFVVKFLFLPRTNELSQPRLFRLLIGFVLTVSGMGAALGLYSFLSNLVQNASWATTTSEALVQTLAYGALAFFALQRFGQIAGWRAPPPRAVSFADSRDLGPHESYQPDDAGSTRHAYGAPPSNQGPTSGLVPGAAPPPKSGNWPPDDV